MEESERQYGVANAGYTEHTIERLEFCISTCNSLYEYLLETSTTDTTDTSVLTEYLDELTDSLTIIRSKWVEHASTIESSVFVCTPPTAVTNCRGRPRFEVNKDQLKYLSSLSFKWNEIAAMLGISRMTVCTISSMVSSPYK